MYNMIYLTSQQLSDMHSHGEEAYPYECCGAMLGEWNRDQSKNTKKLIRIENNWKEGDGEETRHRRFAITAEDYKKIENQAKNDGLNLLGFYHTHPDHPPKPSGTDLSYAWPFFSYIILSVQKAKAQESFSYALDLDRNILYDEGLKIIN